MNRINEKTQRMLNGGSSAMLAIAINGIGNNVVAIQNVIDINNTIIINVPNFAPSGKIHYHR